VAELAQAAGRLPPAEDLLDAFPFALTNRMARVPRRPLVDRAVLRLGDVRRHLESAD